MEKLIQNTPLFYKGYVELAKGETPLEAIKKQAEEINQFFITAPFDQFEYQYEKGKWTVKEVIQHCIDTERIMSYRALALSRNEKQPINGYNEDAYVEQCNGNERNPEDLANEWIDLRKSTIHLFNSFNEIMMKRSGSCDGKELSVEILGAIIAGHATHHIQVIQEWYFI